MVPRAKSKGACPTAGRVTARKIYNAFLHFLTVPKTTKNLSSHTLCGLYIKKFVV